MSKQTGTIESVPALVAFLKELAFLFGAVRCNGKDIARLERKVEKLEAEVKALRKVT